MAIVSFVFVVFLLVVAFIVLRRRAIQHYCLDANAPEVLHAAAAICRAEPTGDQSHAYAPAVQHILLRAILVSPVYIRTHGPGGKPRPRPSTGYIDRGSSEQDGSLQPKRSG